jgi:hypothetical protein
VGYRGAKLANIFPDAPARQTVRRITDKGGDLMLAQVKAHTPVESGELKASWLSTPAKPGFDLLGFFFKRTVFTEVSYAPYVEYPTGLYGPKHAKYPIRPKDPAGWLHWVGKDGKDHFAKLVMHPGSKGAFMLAKAMHDVKVELPIFGMAGVEEWVKEMEAVIDKEAAAGRARMAA